MLAASTSLNGEQIACDTVIICTGIRSNIALARDCGIAVGRGERFAEGRGESHLVAVLRRVPELATGSLTLRPLSGGITNRNFLVEDAGEAEQGGQQGEGGGHGDHADDDRAECQAAQDGVGHQ